MNIQHRGVPGYPARIIAVCDAFDAMISNRPYRPARSLDDALSELEQEAGHQFDRNVVEAFTAEVRRSVGQAA